MRFNTIKEMEAGLTKVTSLKELQQDITFATQGEFITVRYIGTGNSQYSKEVAWLGDDTADNVRAEFTGEGDSITVTRVKTNKY